MSATIGQFPHVESLLPLASDWIGTPFHPHGRVRGPRGGVSCETFPLMLYIEWGFLPADWVIPSGSIAWGQAHRRSLMTDFLDDRPEFESVIADVNRVDPGDLIGFRIGRVVHHLGVALLWPQFIHCLSPGGVQINLLTDATWLKRFERIWRPRAR